LHDSGYTDLSAADISRVRAYWKANGYEHIGQVDVQNALNSTPVTMASTPSKTVIQEAHELLRQPHPAIEIVKEMTTLAEQMDTFANTGAAMVEATGSPKAGVPFLLKARPLLDRYIFLTQQPEIASFVEPRGTLKDGSYMLACWQKAAAACGLKS
jgi:hypothetical protein